MEWLVKSVSQELVSSFIFAQVKNSLKDNIFLLLRPPSKTSRPHDTTEWIISILSKKTSVKGKLCAV